MKLTQPYLQAYDNLYCTETFNLNSKRPILKLNHRPAAAPPMHMFILRKRSTKYMISVMSNCLKICAQDYNRSFKLRLP